MRILTLNANLKQVGTYGRCFFFSRELARAGHDVTMFTVSRDSCYRPRVYYKRDYLGDFQQPDGPGPWFRVIEGPRLGYKWLPGWGSGPIDIALRARELFAGSYDAVYGFEYQPNVSWPVYASIGLARYRFFSDWCDWYAGASNWLRGNPTAHRIDAFFEEQIRYQADKVTVISSVLRDRALAMGIAESRVEQVRQGIDTEYCAMLPQPEMRARFGISPQRPVIVATADGDLCRYIRILERIVRGLPQALMIIIGTVPENARLLGEELGLTRSLLWAGWVAAEDYPCYLACSDLCILRLDDTLLNRARFPGKLLDYLSAGRAVATNDVGEVGPIFHRHDVGGLLPQDDEQFAEGCVDLLQDRGLCRDLGRRARQVAVEEWDWRIRGQQIAAIVES